MQSSVCSLVSLANASAVFFTSGSSGEILPMPVDLCGHSSSGCFRKSGPCIQRSLFNNASTVIPLDASSAGICIVSTCLHCVAVDWSRIAEIRFATKV